MSDAEGAASVRETAPDRVKNPNKVFVGGLGQNTTSETLREYFSTCGAVVEAKVVTEKGTSRSRGFGFVIFEESDPEAIDKALGEKHKVDGVLVG